MAVFKAFKAFRPSVKNQALIPALPYDVMNTEEAREMVKVFGKKSRINYELSNKSIIFANNKYKMTLVTIYKHK